jgi:hypothetical protein
MAAALSVAIYIGAYYATIVPYGRHAEGTGPWHSYQVGDVSLPYEAHAFFSPAHWIDRKLRPRTWWIRDEFPEVRLIIESPEAAALNADAKTAMLDRQDGLLLLADFFDDVARFTASRLMFPLVVLMIGAIWIVSGCYGLVRPDKMVYISRRMRWFVSASPKVNKALSCVTLVAGCMALAVSIHFFIHRL